MEKSEKRNTTFNISISIDEIQIAQGWIYYLKFPTYRNVMLFQV